MPDYPGDWLPSRGWIGWRASFDLRNEEELWERYLFEYEPAWPSEVVSKSLGAPILRRRATEIAITLSSEPLNVRRVSRWRRHHGVRALPRKDALLWLAVKGGAGQDG
jgi:hypothetical protein